MRKILSLFLDGQVFKKGTKSKKKNTPIYFTAKTVEEQPMILQQIAS